MEDPDRSVEGISDGSVVLGLDVDAVDLFVGVVGTVLGLVLAVGLVLVVGLGRQDGAVAGVDLDVDGAATGVDLDAVDDVAVLVLEFHLDDGARLRGKRSSGCVVRCNRRKTLQRRRLVGLVPAVGPVGGVGNGDAAGVARVLLAVDRLGVDLTIVSGPVPVSAVGSAAGDGSATATESVLLAPLVAALARPAAPATMPTAARPE